MTIRATGALTLVAVLTAGACGTTYVDSEVTTPPTGPVVTTTLAPVAADAPLDDVLTEVESLMQHLDEQIIDRDTPDATLARLEELWAVAEQQIRDRDPDDLFPYEQAMTLARSGVQRNRPADASKGYRLLVAALAVDTVDA
jgi:hypothetical protein